MSPGAARHFLESMDAGVLSTLSADMPGYPSGSLVAYALDADGAPLLQLSAIADHSKNIARDPRVAFTVADVKEGDIQNSLRLTLIADAVKLSPAPDAARERYYAQFPAAREYGERLDFSFYKLVILKARFIGGFGRIAVLGPEEFTSKVKPQA